MKKYILPIIAAAALVGTTAGAIAGGDKKSGHSMMNMKQFDNNGDNMLSKEEFMKAHEAMFDQMKTKNGMIAMNDMPKNCMAMMMNGGMMGHGNSSGDGGMMGHGNSSGDGGMMGHENSSGHNGMMGHDATGNQSGTGSGSNR